MLTIVPQKGIRIRTINLIMLVMSILAFILILYSTVQIAHDYEATLKAMNNYMDWESAARAIQTGSDYLTDQAKFYTSTLNIQYADNYFRELYSIKSRENALEQLTSNNLHHHPPDHDCELQQAVDLSDALAQKEIYAIRLVADATHTDLDSFPNVVRQVRLNGHDRLLPPDAKINQARKMMFAKEYEDTKEEIHDLLANFMHTSINTLHAAEREQNRNLGEAIGIQRLLIIGLFIVTVLTFVMIITLVTRPLKICLKCIKADKKLKVTGAYEFRQLAATYNDIFAIKEYHEKMLKQKAEHDPLTGLLNRAAFDSLKGLLKGPGSNIGLLLIDVDKFKLINDTWGHKTGDATLCNVAGLLQANFRSDDYCIRLGGDEFAIIFQAADSSIEKIIHEKVSHINQALLNPQESGLPPVSLSVGGAISPIGFAKDLYKEADLALYQVKAKGRCGCRFYHADTGVPA